MKNCHSISLALKLVEKPTLTRQLRELPLPQDIQLLLAILAHSSEVEEWACQITEQSVEKLHLAAEYFVTQVMLEPDANALRVLGGFPGASREYLRANMGYLLRWSHPDMTRDDSRTFYFQRVINAWDNIKLVQPHPEKTSASSPLKAVIIPARSVVWKRRRKTAWFKIALMTAILVAFVGAILIEYTWTLQEPEWAIKLAIP